MPSPIVPMSSVDAAWYRMDRPENSADVVALLGFDQMPPARELRRLVEERLLACPKFRQRPVVGALSGGSWEDDPHFDLDAHLRPHTLPSAGQDALQDLVGQIASAPLDPARSPWRLHFIRQPSGSGALVAKLSHCIGDGFALVALVLTLADRALAVPGQDRVAPGSALLNRWLSPGATLRGALLNPLQLLTLGWSSARLATATARMMALPADAPTRLQRPLSGTRRTAWSRGFPLEAIRAAAHAAGATINDLLVAAAAGALREHLAAVGDDASHDLRALVPVNLRSGPPDVSGGRLGNRFGLVFLDLPIAAEAPADRLRLVRERANVIKQSPDAIAAYMLLGALGAVPGTAGWGSRFFSRKASVVITNVPGPRERLEVMGRHVSNAMFWVPHPATLGVGISILSYAGEVRVGVRSDVAVMPDPDDLVRRFEQELAELGAALPEPAPAPARPARTRRAPTRRPKTRAEARARRLPRP